MVRSSGFGSTTCNFRPFKLAFASAPYLKYLTSLHIVTRRPVLQKVRYHACPKRGVALYLLVSIRFQVLFHSPPGVLFTFPSQYYYSIGHQIVFSLRRWSSCLPARFLVSRGTPDTHRYLPISRTRLSLSLVQVSTWFRYLPLTLRESLPLHISLYKGLGSFPFARHYSGNRFYFLFL